MPEVKYYMIYSPRGNSVLELKGKTVYYKKEEAEAALAWYKTSRQNYTGDRIITEHTEYIKEKEVKKKDGFGDFGAAITNKELPTKHYPDK